MLELIQELLERVSNDLKNHNCSNQRTSFPGSARKSGYQNIWSSDLHVLKEVMQEETASYLEANWRS